MGKLKFLAKIGDNEKIYHCPKCKLRVYETEVYTKGYWTLKGFFNKGIEIDFPCWNCNTIWQL